MRKKAYDIKEVTEKWNLFRLHKQGIACSHKDVENACKTAGITWNHRIVKILIQYKMINKTSDRKYAKFWFTPEPIHTSKVESVLNEYYRSMPRQVKSRITEDEIAKAIEILRSTGKYRIQKLVHKWQEV